MSKESVKSLSEVDWDLSVKDVLKWKTYYLYFYFYEDMKFTKFLDLVQEGRIPKREVIDWDKVGYINKDEIFAVSL